MRNHKSLLAWQEAHAVVVAVFPGIRRALSVQLNIAEGYALRTTKRFRNHLDIAYGSAVETAELLELSTELHLLPDDLTASALQRCHQCQRLLRGLIKHVRSD